MSDIVKTRFEWRRGTAAQWTTANPVLLEGEPGYETDTGKHKVGDGVTAWSGLPYFLDEPALSATYVARDLSSFGAATAVQRQPFNSTQTVDAAATGTDDKAAHVLVSQLTGNFGASTGSNPDSGFGLNVFTTTGSNAGDGAGGRLCNLIETDVQTPAGTTIPVVQGLVAQAAFYGATAGATVTQMESMRVAKPDRKDGATAGTAGTAYGLFIETVDGSTVGAGAAFALFVEGGVSRFMGRVDVAGIVGNTADTLTLCGGGYAQSGTASLVLERNSGNAAAGNATMLLDAAGSSFLIYDRSGGAVRFQVGKDGHVGFFGANPAPQQGLPAAATDATSTQALANAIRTALINYGLAV